MKHVLYVVFFTMITLLNACLSKSKPEEVKEEVKKETSRYGYDKLDYYDEPVYGNVESMTVTKYTFYDSFGEKTKKKEWQYTYCYQTKENCVEIIAKRCYGFNSSDEKKYEKEYDLTGNMVAKTCYFSDGTIYWKDIYKYDSKGNNIERNCYNSKGERERTYIYKYNSARKIIEEEMYLSRDMYFSNKLFEKRTYKYNSSGRRVNVVEYCRENLFNPYSEMKINNQYKYRYDSAGKIVEEIDESSAGTLYYKCIYKNNYDSKGNVVEQVKYYADISDPVEVIEYEIVYRE